MNYGHKSTGLFAFLINSDVKFKFLPISNKIATLTLQVEAATVGLLGCCSPIDSSENANRRENFYRLTGNVYGTMSSLSLQIKILEDSDGMLNRLANNWWVPLSIMLKHLKKGLRLLNLCQKFTLNVAGTFFKRTDRRRFTWYHPTGRGAIIVFTLM